MTAATAEQAPTKTIKRVSISELKDEYLSCRDLRHAWAQSSDWNITRNTSGKIIEFTRVVICRKCKTERHETIQVPSMEILKRRYYYPERFLLVGSEHPVSHTKTQEVRKEMLRRLTHDDIS